jgi:hypothetical protein
MTLIGEQDTHELGGSGDEQLNWVTTSAADHSNTHVAAFNKSNTLVTWEEIAERNFPLVLLVVRRLSLVPTSRL